MQSKSKIKYEPIINTPTNRTFNKQISRMPINSVNLSEILHNRIVDELKQFQEDKMLLIEKRNKQPVNCMINYMI